MPAFKYQHGQRPLDGYTVEHGVGRGGFGEVYYAVSDSGRQVALKAVQNYEEVELRGIGHCMNLKSPHLVTIFDVKHNDDGQAFVIMEYIAGPSLRDLLDQSPQGLGTAKAAYFLREMAKGLTYLHDCGIVHRDLKPHNVFYEEGYVKIGDYSLSKAMTSSHRSGHTMTVGTVHYMAPEISRGRYDQTVDIYAMGVMLYEMLTGQPPFLGESIGEVLMKHMTAEVDVRGIEAPLGKVIKKALAKEPADRYSSVQAMVEDVFGAERVQNSVSAFDPQSLSMVARQVAVPAMAGGPGVTQPYEPAVAVVPGSPTPHYSPSESKGIAYRAGRAVGGLASSAGLFSRDVTSEALEDPLDHKQRITLGLVTALVISFGTAQMTGTPTFVCFLLTLCATLGVGISRRWVERLDREDVLIRRMISAGCVAAASLPIVWFFVIYRWPTDFVESTIGMALPFLVMDWQSFCATRRHKRLSLPRTALAALLAAVGAGMADGIPLFGAGIVAAVALTVQVVSPFTAKRKRSSEQRERKSDWLESVGLALDSAGNRAAENVDRQLDAHGISHREEEQLGVDTPEQDVSQQPKTEEVVVSPKRRLVALILAVVYLLTGLGGLHRFYVGKIGTGLLWLLTGGLFGIGQTIDIILIALGVFRDSDDRSILIWNDAGNLPASATRHLESQPVNHYSSIPSDSQLFDGNRLTMGSLMLTTAGGLMLAAALVLGLVVATEIPKAVAAGVFDGLHIEALQSEAIVEFFGMADWYRVVIKLFSTLAIIIGLVAISLLAVSRLRWGGWHVTRVLVAGAGLFGGLLIVNDGAKKTDWAWVATEIQAEHIGPVLDVFLNGDLVPGIISWTAISMVSIFVLAWPAKRRSVAAPEIKPEVGEK